jgi:hypothetical protein
VRGLLEDHLAGLDARIAALRKVRRELAAMIERAQAFDPSTCTDPNRCQSIAAGSSSGEPWPLSCTTPRTLTATRTDPVVRAAGSPLRVVGFTES